MGTLFATTLAKREVPEHSFCVECLKAISRSRLGLPYPFPLTSNNISASLAKSAAIQSM